jgi:hypothetical protein
MALVAFIIVFFVAVLGLIGVLLIMGIGERDQPERTRE